MSSASRSPGDPDGRLTSRAPNVDEEGRKALARALAAVLLDDGEAAALQVHGRTEAAVLVPIYRAADGTLTAVLTRRRDELRHHAGEIAFPGGRRDDGDADLRMTALREAHEEIGLQASGVQLIGALPPTPTITTDYAVYPFVGLVDRNQTWRPQVAEVAAVLVVPLARLRDGYARRRIVRRGQTLRTDVYVVDEHLIWGATARIIGDFLGRLPPELV